MPLITQPMVPSVVSINSGKYNIFHIANEAMFFVMVKVYLCYQIILLFRALMHLILLIHGHKQNEKPSSTYLKGIWEGKCNTFVEMETSSQDDCRLQQTQ